MPGALLLLAAVPLLGVGVRPEEVTELPEIAAAGFTAVRTDLTWSAVERDRGRYDFGSYDALLDGARRFGLTVVLILDYGHPLYDDGQAPRSDEARAAFARFAGAAAGRYRGRGVIWEIWNEPNLPGFWTPTPNADDYVKLVRVVAPAIKAADPDATVAGLSLGGCVWDRAFVREAFAAGLLAHLDAVSIHAYPAATPEDARAFHAELIDLMRFHAPGRTLPILCTELGIVTHDEVRHCDFMTRMVQAWNGLGLPLTIWYRWRDDEEGHYGFLDAAGHRKRAYYAVRDLTCPNAAPPATQKP
jgi:hypothetical protein